MRQRWAVVLLTISQLALASCERTPPPAAEVVPITPLNLIAQSNRLNDDLNDTDRQALVERLADAVEADPVEAADRFERDIGGGGALVQYAQAMLDTGQTERLGRQVAVVLRDGDPNRTIVQALSVSEHQDGTAWFRQAEKAGFFVGGVANALKKSEASSDTVAVFARAMGASVPDRTSSVHAWLRACGSDRGCGLTGPAKSSYGGAFDKISRRYRL